MPFYEFECKSCGREISQIMSVLDYEKLKKENKIVLTNRVSDGLNVEEVKVVLGLECLCGAAFERKFSSFQFEMK